MICESFDTPCLRVVAGFSSSSQLKSLFVRAFHGFISRQAIVFCSKPRYLRTSTRFDCARRWDHLSSVELLMFLALHLPAFLRQIVHAAGTPAHSKPPIHSETASIVKGGRKVLADIACNDSPIIGLVPGIAFAGTPSSNLKSAVRSRSRKSLVIEEASPKSTPIGENLLRSQVQLLLQKVETDLHRAPALRTLCHINGFVDSPTRFAAPTPFNTPAASCCSVDQDTSAAPGTIAPSKPAETAAKCDASGNLLDPQILKTDHVSSTSVYNITAEVDYSSNRQIVIAESVCAEREPRVTQTVPSDSKLIGVESADLFLGKQITRTLLFDSPDKSSVSEKGSYSGEIVTGFMTCTSPTAREVEDDETSQWSVLVNVSSPAGKHDDIDLLGDAHQETGKIEGVTTCSVYEHLQKTREESNKLELLWSDQRRASPYREMRNRREEDDEEAFFEDCYEEAFFKDCYKVYYHGENGEEEEYYDDEQLENVECENLCRSLQRMRVAEECGKWKTLPQAEGKHIRFLYNSDGEEIGEEKVG